MKWKKFIAAIIAFALIIATLSGCSNKQTGTTQTEYQTSSVQRGNISVEVTATGNLVYALREPLSFETGGTVGEILVEVGDEVKEGDLLASLDEEEWQTNIETLEKALKTAQRQPAAKELDLIQAEINVQTAQDSLNSIQEIKAAQDKVTAAENELALNEAMYKQAVLYTDPTLLVPINPVGAPGSNAEYWKNLINTSKTRLADAKKELADIQSGSSTTVSANINTQIKSKELQIELAQKKLEDAKTALEDAKQAVIDAQNALDEAKATSIEIKAPFDGVITAVSVQERATVKKGATVLTIADSSKFEAEMLVNETDIMKISIGTQSTIELSSLSGVSFPARVVTIAPVATVSQSVVNYKVRAELTNIRLLQSTATSQTAEQSEKARELLDTALEKAVKDGRITQAQADQLKTTLSPIMNNLTAEQIEQWITRQAQGGTAAAGQGGLFQGRLGQAGNLTQEQLDQLRQRLQGSQGLTGSQAGTTTEIQNVKLREGLSVTVNLIIQQKQNVLLVPNQAISIKSGKSYVLATKADGTREEREITTGISDWRNTEVVSGLTDGEQISIARTTGTSTASNTSTTQQNQIRIPGVGGGVFR